jgi:iron complex transport system ATP-binding protein
LLLDEPTAGLDLLARETMLATVDQLTRRRPGMTSVIVTHHLEELLPRTTAIALLHGGRLEAYGPPEAVLTAERLGAAFGCPVEVRAVDGRWHWSVTPSVWSRLLADAERGIGDI